MSGSMAALFLTLACLNQEEWNAAAPAMDMGLDDRAGMQCLLEEMGGPQGMATALGTDDQSGFTALFAAAAGCGLGIGGPPGQMPPAATATPEPTAAPTATPTPTEAPTQPPPPSGLWRGITVGNREPMLGIRPRRLPLLTIRRTPDRGSPRRHLRPLHRHLVRQHQGNGHRAHRRPLRGPRQRPLCRRPRHLVRVRV